jgi:hypothetical protein
MAPYAPNHKQLCRNKLLCKLFRALWEQNKGLAPMAIEKKIKILGAVLELPAKKHYQFTPFGPFLGKCVGLALLSSW